jgi:alanine-glyoxylate transaminase/serine-glyoxylate transaminase/serine-pyruvate transaminase
MKYLLMIPGPVECPQEILKAYNGQPVSHYCKEFRDLYLDTARKLSRVLGSRTKWSFLMPGSGTAALETIAATFCSSRSCLVINNGFFGDRLYIVSSRYSSQVDQVLFEKAQPIDLDIVESYLKKKKYDLVWMVHVDTSVGIRNPIKEVAALVKKYDCELFVDAVASSPIEEIRMDEWRIDGIANASQKGFSCPPGLFMVTINEALIENIGSLPAPKSWATDLRVWLDYYHKWNSWHPYPLTIPTNNVNALAKSIEMLEAKGVENRVSFHKDISKRVIRSIRLLDLDIFIPEKNMAHGLTAVKTLGKFNAQDFVKFIGERFSILIGGTPDDKLKAMVFRIAHMTEKQCETRNLVSVIGALGVFMKSQGLKVPVDEAIRALVQGE